MGFILEENHWQTHPQAEALVLGCGGAGTAIIEQLLSGEDGKTPEKITGLEHNEGRLEKLRNDFSHAENLILEASDSSGRTHSWLAELDRLAWFHSFACSHASGIEKCPSP